MSTVSWSINASRRRAMGDGLRATGYGLRATGYGLWAMGYEVNTVWRLLMRTRKSLAHGLWPMALLVLACSPGQKETEILWDRWGVPHIYGANGAELFRGFGYAQMESHANLLLKFYGQARGRGAEYWGGDLNLDEDRYVRRMGIPARAKAWYDAQTPEFKANLDAYADGVNKYAAEHPDQIADSLKVVLPVSAAYVMAHAQRIVHFT